ncbi:uncharacterized protein TrAtP1_001002 [Trichoderma atroviride]|uniref:uncharacterized protein n=1 Tax=Hypocrea atroviridis TaxID=63577 RepID=UPI00331C0AFF|nr:hypothetical protein TrAtP1_001002 [Trichoderma atroviride]
MRAISDATIWSMAKAQVGLLPDTAPCAVPRQRCSQFSAVPAVSLAINPNVFGHAERDAVQRAYAVREVWDVWARMLLASSISEPHPTPPIGCPGAHPLINLCCPAGMRWDGRAWFSPTRHPPLDLSDPMIRLRPPSQVPSPGKRTRVQRDRLVSIWRTQQRRGVSPAIGRVARVAVFQIGGAAVPEIRRATRGMYVFSPLGFPQVLASPETGIAPWLSLEI